MIDYSILIQSMCTVPAPNEPNYVVQINYTYKGTVGEYSSEIKNSLFYKVQQESNFIPYEELTEEIVTEWILNSLGESGVENYQSCIEDQIQMQINPPVTPEQTPLPWISPE